MAKINPNRMELLKLRRREKIARRGHKLLKDKLDELIRRFLLLIKEAHENRSDLQTALTQAFGSLAIARGEGGTTVVAEALGGPSRPTNVEVGTERLIGVKVPTFSLPPLGISVNYSLATTPAILDSALLDFEALMTRLVAQAELEKTVKLLAIEIERTRRRVNALEYILLPQLERTIKEINMSLSEMERANLTRVMKIKEMLEARR